MKTVLATRSLEIPEGGTLDGVVNPIDRLCLLIPHHFLFDRLFFYQ
jgi:hypothetical protein